MKIILNMIVKNEAHTIERCIRSCLPMIDAFVIVDTGSTDDTMEKIAFLSEYERLPGRLVRHEWVNFAHNRQRAMEVAQDYAEPGDFLLFMDADDTLITRKDFERPVLPFDVYDILIRDTTIAYALPNLVRAHIGMEWRDVQHAFLDTRAARRGGQLDNVFIKRGHDGVRRRDPQTYFNDIENISAALKAESDPFMRSRYTFYLAQSYECAHRYHSAIEWYEKRARLGFWSEEIFVALLRSARIKKMLNYPVVDVLATFQRAMSFGERRLEAHHGFAQVCRETGRYGEAYACASRVIYGPSPNGLFVEPWIYEWGMRDEHALAAYHTGNFEEAARLGVRALVKAPANEWPRIVQNISLADAALERSNA